MFADAASVLFVDHRKQKVRRGTALLRIQTIENPHKTGRLQTRQFMRQPRALGAGKQQPLTPVDGSRPCLDKPAIQQRFQHSVEALLGDFEDIEQRCDGETGAAVDEMQHAMMRPPEVVIFQ